jgi:transposase
MMSLKDAKSDVLRRHGVLHRRPHDVTDPLFHASAFFDARDLVQVKYELLRRVQVEGPTVATAAKSFGFSRSAFYQAQQAYQRSGLIGLIPQRRGPRQAHKLSGPVIDFVLQHRAHKPALSLAHLCQLVQEAFGLSVHPRSLERALTRRQKRGPSIAPQAVLFVRIDALSPGPNGMKTYADRR